MKVLIAPAAFKGSMSSDRAAQIIKHAFQKTAPDIELSVLPLVDGGQGFVDHCTRAVGGQIRRRWVTGPLFQPVSAKYGLAREETGRKIALIEMAQTAGLTLVPDKKRNPLLTTTYGVGELAAAAIRLGCRQIIIGCGDSATMDCGLGALSALGVHFLDCRGRPVAPTAQGLLKLARIDAAGLIKGAAQVEWIVAVDVDNRLTGKTGALMFCRQKGAVARVRSILDRGLKNFRQVACRQLGVDPDQLAGGGAAGGLAGGLAAVLAAKIISGFEFYRRLTNLDEKIQAADWIITGEGRLDEQSRRGKAAYRLLKLAENYYKPVTFFTGTITCSRPMKSFIRHRMIEVLKKPGTTVQEAMSRAEHLLRERAIIQALVLQTLLK